MSECGICPSNPSRRNLYPLVKSSCAVSVVDVNIHAKLSQTYVSTSTEAEHVNYVFPVPSDAAVCAFTAVIDGEHTIKGIVKERKQAQRDFDTAVKAGKTAALLKHHTSQVFEVSLGNLKPQQTIAVNVEFISVIAHAGTNDSLRIRIPTSVAPFYGTPPVSLMDSHGVAYGAPFFDLSAAFQMTGNITSITSDTHPVACSLGSLTAESAETFDPTRAHVSLHTTELLRNDIVLELKCTGLDRPRCLMQRLCSTTSDEATDAYSLTLVPRFTASSIASQEYIFLVDRSGSMAGGRIRAVRDALHIMVRSLPSKGSTFNIFSFGDRCDSLWPVSVSYEKDTVAAAATHIDSLSADYGGTEIAIALQTVFDSRKSADGPSKKPVAVFVLTDGEAWDLQRVFANVDRAVKETDKATRIFVLGVGNQVSTEMCDGIARAGRGVATYVREQEKPDAKLVGLLKAARSTLVDQIVVDWGFPAELEADFEMIETAEAAAVAPQTDPAPSAAPLSLFDDANQPTETDQLGPQEEDVQLPAPPRIQQAPAREDALPPMYPGARCTIFALIRSQRDAAQPKSVQIIGNMNGTPVTLDVPVIAAPPELMPKEPETVPFIHSLAARALIQDLEDSATPAPLTAITKAKIARLGTTFHLASSQSSFVAIDERGETVPTKPDVSTISHASSRSAISSQEESDDDMGYGLFDGGDAAVPASAFSTVSRSRAAVAVEYDEEDADEMDQEMGFALYDGDDLSTVLAPALAPAEVSIDPAVMKQYQLELAAATAALPEEDDEFDFEPTSFASSAPLPAYVPPPPLLTMTNVAKMQQFDGSFPAEQSFIINDLQLGSIPSPPTMLTDSTNETKRALWHTIIALALLKKRFPSDEERAACEFLEAKAKEWFLDTLADAFSVSADDGEKLLQEWMQLASASV
ncbi:von Willebrand factor type A domain-containing protein [Auriculariales sp. MPI-PUGE-AT-0066]|nr:von Willebrand factor type A domain-containing protein [Auriculariales sp. MPI-PUGE-AT-0066]